MQENLPKKKKKTLNRFSQTSNSVKMWSIGILQKSLKEQRTQSVLQTKPPQLSRVAYPAHDPTSPFPHKNNLMSLGQVLPSFSTVCHKSHPQRALLSFKKRIWGWVVKAGDGQEPSQLGVCEKSHLLLSQFLVLLRRKRHLASIAGLFFNRRTSAKGENFTCKA